MAGAGGAAAGKSKLSKKSPEEVVAGFNTLRNDQRQIASKIYEIENEFAEHKIVIDALKETEADRKCFRMIGGILVEGTVKEILPCLITNADKMKALLEKLNTQLLDKGKEILEYKEKHPGSFVGSGVPSKIPEEEEPVEAGAPSKSHGGLLATDKT